MKKLILFMITIIYSNPFALNYSNRGFFTDNINWYPPSTNYASVQINEELILPNFEGSVQYYGQIPFGNTNCPVLSIKVESFNFQ